MITQERLKELLHYDPTTGIFVWIENRPNGFKSGRIAGWTDNGYVNISVDSRNYGAHRLAWLYFYGTWPTKHIDHKDHDRSNNRIVNLRDVTRTVNNQNQIKAQRHNKTTGLLGVCLHKDTGKYQATISINGKSRHLGIFDTPELAQIAYLSAKKIYHPETVGLIERQK